MALGSAERPCRKDREGEGPYLCPDCDSSEPVPEDVARAHPGGADIVMRCVNCEDASEMTLVLSPEEAKALGLGPALRDHPETP